MMNKTIKKKNKTMAIKSLYPYTPIEIIYVHLVSIMTIVN